MDCPNSAATLLRFLQTENMFHTFTVILSCLQGDRRNFLRASIISKLNVEVERGETSCKLIGGLDIGTKKLSEKNKWAIYIDCEEVTTIWIS